MDNRYKNLFYHLSHVTYDLCSEWGTAVTERFDKGITKKYSPRFGKIALDMGFITPEQLKLALSEQVDDDLLGYLHRVIGSIFFDRGWMTYQEIETVLQELFREMNNK